MIKEVRVALKELMQKELASIGDDLIEDVMRAYRNSIPSQQVNAAKGIVPKGARAYKDLLKTALSVIALDAIEAARKEVPKAKKVKLAEFESLPAEIQKRILAQSQLIVDTQLGDLQKSVFLQFSGSVDSTDSEALLKKDLDEAAEDFILGTSLEVGATTIAAQTINTARNAFFFTDDVLAEIEAFQFTNGDPVSPICQDLNGTIFAKDDPEADRYMPPLHHNCKSYIVPILVGNLKGRDIGTLKPSSASLEKYIKLSETAICDCGLEKL